MANIPTLSTILVEQGNEPLPDDASPSSHFRRAFLHGEPFTAAEVARRFNCSTTVLPNTVKGLRDFGYTIESTKLPDTGEVLHRVVSVGFVPDTSAVPASRGGGGGTHTGATAKIRAALDAGATIDREWAKANGVSIAHAGQLVKANADKYERIRLGVYRARHPKANRQPKAPAVAEPAHTTEVVAHPPLGQQLMVWGLSMTDDGTLLVALRNGSHIWMTELVGQQQLSS